MTENRATEQSMKKSNFTQPALAELKKMGYTGDVTERWLGSNRTRDFLGIFDIVAYGRGHILGLQITSANNVASRIKKLKESPHLVGWIENGGRAQVWGFRPDGRIRKEHITQ